MHIYTATIGRTVDGKPMPQDEWELFVRLVKVNLAPVAKGSWQEVHYGQGEYNGVKEESAMITVLSPEEFGPMTLLAIKFGLSSLARVYRQESIALTIGSSELIYA